MKKIITGLSLFLALGYFMAVTSPAHACGSKEKDDKTTTTDDGSQAPQK